MATQTEIEAFTHLLTNSVGKTVEVTYRRSGPGKGFRLKKVAGIAIGRGLFIGRSFKAAFKKLATLAALFG